ncbi:transaldolase [Coxiella endosymbiont of Ornithodoros amblus]|uniref:transaldolase n=1 Tax=Coxiella endosymbiont of Ornithodoros amblus TaxID=1656166 RepID=UPI00244E0828|nr:transaldolase [Coxiella endosymbiont of Ornithodoros amblus]MBW5802279.1 transaldolase [Coxiella endosymbiont of Ornithodoros amblus]
MENNRLHELKVKIFADGANLEEMIKFSTHPYIKGLTTNPTLMRQAGIVDYEAFGHQALTQITKLPVSLEVFADELDEMEDQARHIASWGNNVNIKIPVTNTKGQFTGPIIRRLSEDGIILNITALTTHLQVEKVCQSFADNTPGIVSVFAGRVADSGRDPEDHMRKALEIVAQKPSLELLWASPRELFNIIQANRIGCHIITVAHNILAKLPLLGKDLTQYSLETVQMFARDAQASCYSIHCSSTVL